MPNFAAHQSKVMRNIVAGNWKSNKLLSESEQFMDELLQKLSDIEKTEVLICPPAPFLATLASKLAGHNKLEIAAQQCSRESMGAFTGEFSAEMLSSCGIKSVLIGHSERREFFGETDDAVRKKVQLALQAGLRVIFCCGESLKDRMANNHFQWVEGQLNHALSELSLTDMGQIIIAYEPIWAIGTGQTATAEQAQEMHAHIRSWLAAQFSEAIAAVTPILYGGSCKPSNATELFRQKDVNGGLIGGAALEVDSFMGIIEAAEACSNHGSE